MDNKTNNYSKPKKGNKKKLIALLLLITSVLILAGTAAAYFSDVLFTDGNLNSGSLKIDGEYTVLLNGEETDLSDIKTLMPGDVIVVRGSIQNVGDQNAWIRERVSFTCDDQTLVNYFRVYCLELDQADFIIGQELNEGLMPIDGMAAASDSRVINGVGKNAREELFNGEYIYIDDEGYTFELTVYFMHTAPNNAQGKSFNLTVETQALQFTNNHANTPNEAAWSVVAAA